MKTTLIALFSVILCISLILVSCGDNAGSIITTEKPSEPVKTNDIEKDSSVSDDSVTPTAEPTAEASLEPEIEGIQPLFDKISAGSFHVVGLSSANEVIGAGANGEGEITFTDWSDVIMVKAGSYRTFGLKANGTILATRLPEYLPFPIESWENIAKIETSESTTLGLLYDGTVIAYHWLYETIDGLNEWCNIIDMGVSITHAVGLRENGTVVSLAVTGDFSSDPGNAINTGSWVDIVQVEAAAFYTAGLKSDGNIEIIGDYSMYVNSSIVDEIEDVVMISANSGHLVALHKDGTVSAVGRNTSGECDVDDWNDIVSIEAGYDFTLGLKSDGTVVSTGADDSFRDSISSWIISTN